MAATMHAKLNRRKLDQIDIIKICEEILNPVAPMALRLSSILMGGVVIVYERKVRLLYDDVNRLLVEINEAWSVKPAKDPTILPKRKRQAKFEAVTLPVQIDTDLGKTEQFMNSSSKVEFEIPEYFAMHLDNVGESIDISGGDDLLHNHSHHQADTADITLNDPFDHYQTKTGPFNGFERFDMEGDEETLNDYRPSEHLKVRLSPVLGSDTGPERNEGIEAHDHLPDKTHDQQPEKAHDQQPETAQDQQPEKAHDQQSEKSRSTSSSDSREPERNLHARQKPKRKGRKPASLIIDDDHTIIPGNLYQSWLKDTSDIVSQKGRGRKHVKGASITKMDILAEMPNILLPDEQLGKSINDIHYPPELIKLWIRSVQPSVDSPPSRKNYAAEAPDPSSSSPEINRKGFENPQNFPHGEFQNGVGSESVASIEKQRTVLVEGLLHPSGINFISTEIGGIQNNLKTTPINPGSDPKSMSSVPIIGSGHSSLSSSSNENHFRSNKKRPYSSSKQNGGGLGTLDEENQFIFSHTEPNFTLNEDPAAPMMQMHKQPRIWLTPEHELLVETGLTETQYPPVIDEELENRTATIQTHLKEYFETPGAPQKESLNQLADGMRRKQAAELFYQTTVLANRGILKVEQATPYGDILISRGPSM